MKLSYIFPILVALSTTAGSAESDPVIRDDILCSVHPDGQAILFFTETDEVVGANFSQAVFNDTVLNPETLDEAVAEHVIGHCYAEELGEGDNRSAFTTDAYSCRIIGDFRPDHFGLCPK